MITIFTVFQNINQLSLTFWQCFISLDKSQLFVSSCYVFLYTSLIVLNAFYFNCQNVINRKCTFLWLKWIYVSHIRVQHSSSMTREKKRDCHALLSKYTKRHTEKI